MSGHRHHMKLPEAGCVASALLNSPIAIRPAQKQLAIVGVESTHLIHISSEKPSSSAVTETETEVLISAYGVILVSRLESFSGPVSTCQKMKVALSD